MKKDAASIWARFQVCCRHQNCVNEVGKPELSTITVGGIFKLKNRSEEVLADADRRGGVLCGTGGDEFMHGDWHDWSTSWYAIS